LQPSFAQWPKASPSKQGEAGASPRGDLSRLYDCRLVRRRSRGNDPDPERFGDKPIPSLENERHQSLAKQPAGCAFGRAHGNLGRLVGPVERLPTWKFVRFNWRVTPDGSDEQQAIILKAVEILRSANPYIN
jgi:hypothetical protein